MSSRIPVEDEGARSEEEKDDDDDEADVGAEVEVEEDDDVEDGEDDGEDAEDDGEDADDAEVEDAAVVDGPGVIVAEEDSTIFIEEQFQKLPLAKSYHAETYHAETYHAESYHAESYHPEVARLSMQEVQRLANVVRLADGTIGFDVLHQTLPILSKFEMTRVLGQRAKQLNAGARSFIDEEFLRQHNISDGLLIARLELERKKIPFIIVRPLPGRTFEYWRVADLEVLL